MCVRRKLDLVVAVAFQGVKRGRNRMEEIARRRWSRMSGMPSRVGDYLRIALELSVK